ncbi:helix-turn-helix domain-containing protein [Paracoccus cavernae]
MTAPPHLEYPAAYQRIDGAKPVNKTLIPENMTVARLLTQKEVAEILGVSEKWIERDRWVERRIPFTKIGRSVRYRAADLNAYIDANTRIFD